MGLSAKFIGIYPRSQVSVYRTIGPQVVFHNKVITIKTKKIFFYKNKHTCRQPAHLRSIIMRTYGFRWQYLLAKIRISYDYQKNKQSRNWNSLIEINDRIVN